jgi:hypothetical protein
LQGRSDGILPEGTPTQDCDRGGAAEALPQLSLLDALQLTMLIARKDSSRYPRVAARWLRRPLEEYPDLTIEQVAVAASCLVALPGAGYLEAAQTLRAMAERATRRRRDTESGVRLATRRVRGPRRDLPTPHAYLREDQARLAGRQLSHAALKGAYGIRTRAAAVRGRCPRPLDECARRGLSVATKRARSSHARHADPRDVDEEDGVVMSGPGGAPQAGFTPEEGHERDRPD